jgi:hypothetical protein
MRAIRETGLAVLLCGLATASLAAQAGFEGVIEFKEFNKHGTGTMVQTSKGSLIRIDNFHGGQGKREEPTLILDTKARTMTVLIPENHMYLVQPLAPGGGGPADPKRQLAFKNSGRTETVAGIKCEIYIGTVIDSHGKTSQFEACLAKGVGFALFDAMGSRGPGSNASGPDLFRDLAAKNLYVLKAWEFKDGERVPAMEATKVEQKAVPASVFEVPAGFTKMDMPARKKRNPER